MASWDLGTGMGLDLECDDCGYVLLLPGADQEKWRPFWRRATVIGWRGAPTPDGPHTCPDCTAETSAAA
jgi:hypothetical protein